MLAASAENPRLLDPVREVIKATLETLEHRTQKWETTLRGKMQESKSLEHRT